MNNAGTKVAVAIPSGGEWKPDFGMSLAAMIREFFGRATDVTRGVALDVYNTRGSMLPHVRHTLLASAMKREATHILWLDDDMTFPRTLVHDLLSAGKDFVAAVGMTKEENPKVAAKGLDGQPVDLGQDGLVQVQHVGLACALIRLEPLRTFLPPFFNMQWVEASRAYCGEDVFFCARWRSCGGEVWVDRTLSRSVGHIGEKTYRWGG